MRKIKKIFTLDKALLLSDMGNELLYSEPNKKYQPKYYKQHYLYNQYPNHLKH